ncbi:hypothetical protein EYV94_07465 [Puteibacter caeruleilacunae]|nr:hypothetical protein EYV94_07465 [Puteibacter caeruleilacunae]
MKNQLINKIYSKQLLLFQVAMLIVLVSNANDNKKLGIVPQPSKVEIIKNGGDFVLGDKTKIFYEDGLKELALFLQSRIQKSTGYKLALTQRSFKGGIGLFINSELNVSNEAYTIRSNKKSIKIVGTSPQGTFWGIQTLFQLLPPKIYSKTIHFGVRWTVPSVKITDVPFFKRFRGMHIDISRHFRTKEEILETIDMMAMHKLNTLHLHFSDDDGWRIESKLYPKLTSVGAQGNRTTKEKGDFYFLTQEEVKEIIAYAKTQYIRVLPEIDMPGHMHAVIRAYPDLGSENDTRKEKKVIRIDEKGAEFCRNILYEMHQLFNSTEFHLGFDEVNLGAEVYTDEEITKFAIKMSEFVKQELNVIPILWDDAFEKGVQNPNYLIHWWRFGKIAWWKDLEMPIDEKLQKLNQPYILSPGNYTYLDMANTSNDPGAEWAGPVSVAQIYAWEPLLDLTNHDNSKDHLAQGIICAVWSERIKDMNTFEERVYPRLAALSEKCWSGSMGKEDRLPWGVYRDEILSKQLERYSVLDINYWSIDNPDKLKRLKSHKKVGKKSAIVD